MSNNSFSGYNSGTQVAANYGNISTNFGPKDHQECLKNLRVSNPCDEKDRIENDKGGLLKDSYRWILDHVDFKQWQNDPDSRLLWIKGDPGKGKTMLLCGIINELRALTNETTTTISFFFCQAAEPRINNATAVLRGLLYLVLDQQPALLPHIQKEYDKAGKELFEDANTWYALSRIFTDILQDPLLQSTYLIIDGLDECTHDLPLLLDLISENSSANPNVKWIVSSRNWTNIEESLNTANQKVRLCLELNENSITEAVTIYIHHKVQILAKQKNFDEELLEAVRHHLLTNALGTFLWVALVCEELLRSKARNTRKLLNAFPAGLDPLYQRMMECIQESEDAEDAELCKRVLAVVAIVYRPITLEELPVLVEIPDHVSKKDQHLADLIADCGSFLSLRGRTLSLVHQSATDFLLQDASNERFLIFPQGAEAKHRELFFRSLQAISATLRRDIYGIKHPGFPVERVRAPNPDPLATVRYSCLYWVDHLKDSDPHPETDQSLLEADAVDNFFRQNYLHWIEALSLLRSTSEGIAAIIKLDNLLQVKKGISQAVLKRVGDASRFIQYYGVATESSPLQVYSSSLIFSPTQSITRLCYQTQRPGWLVNESAMADNWSSCLQTLEGHSHSVDFASWSPDGSRLASRSDDGTINIWDPVTGRRISTLKADWCWTYQWSPDGSHITSLSIVDSASSDHSVSKYDWTFRIWDPITGRCISILEADKKPSFEWSPDGSRFAFGLCNGTVGIWDPVTSQYTSILKVYQCSSITWSPDGSQLASGSKDKTVRIWDPVTAQCISTFEGHTNPITSINWSPDKNRLDSMSADDNIRIWDPITGRCILNFEEVLGWLIAWSRDGYQLASTSNDETIKIWGLGTNQYTSILKGHKKSITSIRWSPDGSRLASVSNDKTVRIWDPVASRCISTLTIDEHGKQLIWFGSIAWSPNGSQLASRSTDRTVRIWDPVTGQCISTFEGHIKPIRSITWSPDGKRLTSTSGDTTVRIWDPVANWYKSTFEGHKNSITLTTWSPDGSRLVSASYDSTVRIWDPVTGRCISTLKEQSKWFMSITWSPDGRQLVSPSENKSIGIWNPVTGRHISTLKGHSGSVICTAWSPDGSQLASGSDDKTIRIWNPVTRRRIATLKGHSSSITFITWSPDKNRLASTSTDQTVRIWDLVTGRCISNLKGQSEWFTSIAWSLDGSRLASASYHNQIVRIWDPVTGECLSTLDAHSPEEFQFDKVNLNHLHTSLGTFSLATDIRMNTPLDGSSPLPHQPGYGLSDDRTWITYEGENLLWLPSEFRPTVFASSNISSSMAIGCSSGRVLIFNFSKETPLLNPVITAQPSMRPLNGLRILTGLLGILTLLGWFWVFTNFWTFVG